MTLLECVPSHVVQLDLPFGLGDWDLSPTPSEIFFRVHCKRLRSARSLRPTFGKGKRSEYS